MVAERIRPRIGPSLKWRSNELAVTAGRYQDHNDTTIETIPVVVCMVLVSCTSRLATRFALINTIMKNGG